jgi:hypothetical protein
VEITGCNEEMFSQVDCGKGEALPVFGKDWRLAGREGLCEAELSSLKHQK